MSMTEVEETDEKSSLILLLLSVEVRLLFCSTNLFLNFIFMS